MVFLKLRWIQLLKGPQVWRDFDHQSVQSVSMVRCKPQAVVDADKFQLDYFEILSSLSGAEAVRTREQWNAVREAAGKPTHLEPLAGDSETGSRLGGPAERVGPHNEEGMSS